MVSRESKHDFSRPIAQQRKRIYTACAAWATLLVLACILLVGAGVFPLEPTGFIMTALLIPAIFTPPIVAWRDAPGESRTQLEKAYEFILVWFPITAIGSEIAWELPWLVGDLFGWMNFTGNDPWGFYWSFYGFADTRYLESDPSLWAMEVVAVAGGISMLVQFLRLRNANADDRTRINALWWSLFTVSLMVAVCVIYYVSEIRFGLVHLQQGFWGLTVKIILVNIPWMVAPLITVPLCVRLLSYLIRQDALASVGTTDDPVRRTAEASAT
ncbi:hypothetical protein BRW65_01530 [Mycobacterium paraffinicum]|uniref:Emopamil-binding protein n=1 Tax=Mycobacterium paraffinicum TaxID=53378 RepID=A0A1Q4I2D2_9MYCO|nr:hypothetical protein [Mycobacterium paraffinicum]OJZ76139.1 hypothetical protein BRW65_01530 [Mycobacterium paraffinicum]